MKFVLMALVIVMSIGVNLSDNMLTRIGLDPNLLLVALVAVVITGLTVHRRLAFVVLVILMTVGANLPRDFALALGFDPDYLFAGLVAIVVTPHLAEALG